MSFIWKDALLYIKDLIYVQTSILLMTFNLTIMLILLTECDSYIENYKFEILRGNL